MGEALGKKKKKKNNSAFKSTCQSTSSPSSRDSPTGHRASTGECQLATHNVCRSAPPRQMRLRVTHLRCYLCVTWLAAGFPLISPPSFACGQTVRLRVLSHPLPSTRCEAGNGRRLRAQPTSVGSSLNSSCWYCCRGKDAQSFAHHAGVHGCDSRLRSVGWVRSRRCQVL